MSTKPRQVESRRRGRNRQRTRAPAGVGAVWLVLEGMAAMIRSTIGVTRVTLWWWRQGVTS